MAHGKSAELNELPKRTATRVCGTCGKTYENHLMEEGDLKPEFKDHVPAGQSPQGLNRHTRRAYGIGVKKPQGRRPR